MIRAGIAALAGCALMSAAHADLNSPSRLDSLSQLPDWNGIWQVEGSSATLEPQPAASPASASGSAPAATSSAAPADGAAADAAPRDHAPYTAEWEAKYTQARAALGTERDTYQRYCAAGVPRLVGSPYRFMVVVTPEETLIQYATREIRHVWTDGRAHPASDELWPMHWGDSIGHWEHQTLVIDTISIKGDLWLDPTGATLSDQAHITERLSMPDKNHLRDDISIIDPQALTQPWIFTRTYRRAPTKELTEQHCSWSAGEASRPSR